MIIKLKYFHDSLNNAVISLVNALISFNIYRMNLNKGHFSFGTAIIHFGDKPYQKINFKSHSNTELLCK